MKIHSDTLTTRDIHKAVPDGCYLAYFSTLDGRTVFIDTIGSRSHDRAYIVRLSGSGKTNMRGLPDKAATYEEWGYFIANLFTQDESAICGNYKSAADFDFKTESRFPMVAS